MKIPSSENLKENVRREPQTQTVEKNSPSALLKSKSTISCLISVAQNQKIRCYSGTAKLW